MFGAAQGSAPAKPSMFAAATPGGPAAAGGPPASANLFGAKPSQPITAAPALPGLSPAPAQGASSSFLMPPANKLEATAARPADTLDLSRQRAQPDGADALSLGQPTKRAAGPGLGLGGLQGSASNPAQPGTPSAAAG